MSSSLSSAAGFFHFWYLDHFRRTVPGVNCCLHGCTVARAPRSTSALIPDAQRRTIRHGSSPTWPSANQLTARQEGSVATCGLARLQLHGW